MNDHEIQLRQLSIDDADQYNKLLRYAFQVTEKTLLDYGWENEDIRQSKFPVLERASVLGCFDGTSLVSQFAVYPLEMNIHASIYPIGFITSVASYPEYSGLGLMSRLMKQSLVAMRERGQSLALLYPYSIPLYRHRGWEIISDKMTYRITDQQLPKAIEAPGYVRRVAPDSRDLIDLHTRFACQTHGCLLRNDLAWEEYWRWNVDDMTVAIYYTREGVATGYMVYLIDEDVMHINEMIHLNLEAKKGLFKYVAAHDSMIDEVHGNNYYGEPIAFSLPDSDIRETIRPYIMGRIVDFERFLQYYHFRPGAESGTVTLCVEDDFLEWNHRCYTLALQGGHGALVEAPAAPRATLSIGTLTTLLLGYKSASELAALERITGDPAAIRFLDAAVVRRNPYISDYF